MSHFANEMGDFPKGEKIASTPPSQGDQTPPNIPQTPTQITHPWRSMLRTTFQATPGVVAAVPLIVAAVDGDNPELLGPIGVGAIAVAAGIARVMNVPQVNALLTSWGLGATGKHEGGS